jgi:MbtH protein
MSSDEREDTTIYRVVFSAAYEQYSIWPEYKENALGWTDVGKTGTKEECLAYIRDLSPDVRPINLR